MDTRKKAKPNIGTPSKVGRLQRQLVALEESSYPTPMREDIQAMTIQNYVKDSIEYHNTDGAAASPNTELFHFACAQIGQFQ
jgi:hypothetical protein